MLPPAALLRMMGIDPAQMKEIEKVVATVDTKKISAFIDELPLLTERVKKINQVFEVMQRSGLDLENAVDIVYAVKMVELVDANLETMKVTPGV